VSPVCGKCRCVMRCHRNGCAVRVGDKVYEGDVWRCPECGADIVTGFGKGQAIKPTPEVVVFDMEVHHGS